MHQTALALPDLAPAAPCRCKICGGEAPVFGTVDFNRHTSKTGEPLLPWSKVQVSYNRCAACGFLFSPSFDQWTHEQFQDHIYNDEYALIDPDYAYERPTANLTWLEALFGASKANLRLLDYGGGNGMLAQLAREAGFINTETYDPFTLEYSRMPTEIFDVVTSFETLEHVPDPLKTIGEWCRLAGDTGIILFSTLLQQPDILQTRMDWWYIVPRNGHISLFSDTSLKGAFEQFGFKVAFFDHNKFLAFREIPPFAEHLFHHWRETGHYIT